MEEQFMVYGFRFIDKETRAGAVIYARSEETALKIINKWNEMQNIYHWIKPRFRFMRRYLTSIPPYELEQEQIEAIDSWEQKYRENSSGKRVK